MLRRFLPVRWVLRELGKMRTAIGLLGLCALASLAATWLPQGAAIQDYVARYGARQAWWLDFFGLTDVVRAWWFIGLLAILLASVAVCLGRNGPAALREILRRRPPRAAAQTPALRRGGSLPPKLQNNLGQASRMLRRLGYLLAHGGVLLIALGGLLTGFAGWRGVLNLRDGETDRMVLVFRGDKVTAHRLPFTLINRELDIEQFGNGMPRRFATTLQVDGKASMLVEVNHPLTVDGYTIYQATFGDGGSGVKGLGVSLRDGAMVPFGGKVHEAATLVDGTRIELLDFRPNTVESMVDENGKRLPPVDVGPSLDYLVQPPDAPARQLRSYLMHPAVLGVADAQDEDTGKVGYAPVWLGVVEPQLWPVVARLAESGFSDFTQGAGLALFKHAAGPVLARLPESRRMVAGLGVLQAVKTLRGLGLTHLVLAQDYDLKRYSGLQVAYDPGAQVFWLGAVLGALGVMLMLVGGQRLPRGRRA
jgi:cytochrome c biogenesis protein ResB